MIRFREKGGTTVSAGTYWNFETGEKIVMDQAGSLPGRYSQTFCKLPPLLILAAAAAAMHVLLYILPSYLVQFYEAYTEQLVTAYVIIDYIAVGAVLFVIAVLAIGEILGFRVQVPAFNWNPAEAHLAGKRHSNDKPGDPPKADKTPGEAEPK